MEEKTNQKKDVKSKSIFKEIMEWIICIIIALSVALVFRYYIGTPIVVNQTSMYPNLKPGERLILSRTLRITKNAPKYGDIVTFEAPITTTETPDQNNPIAKFKTVNGAFSRFIYYNLEFSKITYIKRVIATEGQHVVIKDNCVYINNKLLDESKYLSNDVVTTSEIYNNFIVPKGYVFCMGDNRSVSVDCRVFGCIPLDKIEGIVTQRFWPLNVFGKIEKAPN